MWTLIVVLGQTVVTSQPVTHAKCVAAAAAVISKALHADAHCVSDDGETHRIECETRFFYRPEGCKAIEAKYLKR